MPLDVPRITTILPTYQRPQLLRRAIESVLAQTVSDFILHIHDNASQDETSFVVDEYQKRDARIRYFRREVNVGLVENFALALDHVSTPFFSFLCDDDYLLPCFSSKPAPVATTQFELLVDHVMKYFVGTATHRDLCFQKLCSMRIGGYRHIWMHSLVANHTQNATHARKNFLEYGGDMPRWKLYLLTHAETSVLTRKLFQLYFLLSKMIRRFLPYTDR